MRFVFVSGYGHISPKTQWGRIFCISYSMMGIPLMLIFLANVGDVLADVFKYIYAKIICCGCMKSRKKRRHSLQRKQSGDPEHAGLLCLYLFSSISAINHTLPRSVFIYNIWTQHNKNPNTKYGIACSLKRNHFYILHDVTRVRHESTNNQEFVYKGWMQQNQTNY